MGISRLFNIAQKSLGVYQGALDVTANNIANSSNADYSRQRAVITNETSQQIGRLSWGTGVKLSDIQRVRDTLVDQQIRANNQKYSDMNQRNTILGQVENLFSEPSDIGLSGLSSAFYNSWQQLSVTPNSVVLRNNVIQAAKNLSIKVKNINDGLDTIKSNIVSETKDKVNSININIKQIQSLNSQILKGKTAGVNKNALMDRRDKVIDALSNLVNINVSYDSNNSAIVSIGGVFVADKASFVQFKSTVINGKLKITSPDGTSTPNLNGGELFALTDTFNNNIPGYQASLDGYINNLVNSLNGQHTKGFTPTNPSLTSIKFFDGYVKGELKINSEILNDPNKIAISKDGTSGNGEIALNIANLFTQKDSNGITQLDSYINLIAQIGNDKKSAVDTSEAYKLSLDQLQKQKASVSGVSIDEEMANVIRYQRSYDASAKLIKVADDMLQTLINIL
ncbi:MAG TPA: flagellar hook-associated protein FlgK [Ignavibacteria bacterium]|nr:flagellar hook-associated protein FlgK [Ignavibacteria bacterium]